jgi:hypothetical protein
MATKKTNVRKIKAERKPKNALSKSELDAFVNLRMRGFAVIAWTPKELRDADPERVEDRLIELGWGIIESLNT